MRIIIKSDNNWHEVIWYVHKKKKYSHIYSSIYDVHAHVILPEKV